MASDEFSRQLGARMRAIRLARRLSLKAVEEAFPGRRLPSTVLGSYERGYRKIDVERLVEIAGFYGVPAADLIP